MLFQCFSMVFKILYPKFDIQNLKNQVDTLYSNNPNPFFRVLEDYFRFLSIFEDFSTFFFFLSNLSFSFFILLSLSSALAWKPFQACFHYECVNDVSDYVCIKMHSCNFALKLTLRFFSLHWKFYDIFNPTLFKIIFWI